MERVNILVWYCCTFRTIDRSNFKPIVHIAPVMQSESNNIHLVAITETGLYIAIVRKPPCNLNLFKPAQEKVWLGELAVPQ